MAATSTHPQPSAYERRAIREILLWRTPKKMGWFSEVVDLANSVVSSVYEIIRNVPGVEWVVDKGFSGFVKFLNDAAQATVRTDAIHAAYREAGHENVFAPSDIFSLDLEQVDRVIGSLDAKYRTLAAVEGAAAGYAGLPGIAPDVAALIALNLRAIGEYATYCGFHLSSQQERLFALKTLELASSPTDATKEFVLAQVIKISGDLARGVGLKELEHYALVKIAEKVAAAVGITLTRAKLAQVVPITGAVVGGGFNAYYTSKVCDAAYFLYRERFLMEKYGPEVMG